jgi:hypothetical protein
MGPVAFRVSAVPLIGTVSQDPVWPFADESIMVGASITPQGSPLAAESLAYSTDGQQSWKRIASLGSQPPVFWFRVPGQPESTAVSYQILAWDDQGGPAQSPVKLCSIPVQHTLYEIRYPRAFKQCPDSGRRVQTAGIISAVLNQRRFMIADAPGGAWRALYVVRPPEDTTSLVVNCGDSVTLIGIVTMRDSVVQVSSRGGEVTRLVSFSSNHTVKVTPATIPQVKSDSMRCVLCRLDNVRFDTVGRYEPGLTYRIRDSLGNDILLYAYGPIGVLLPSSRKVYVQGLISPTVCVNGMPTAGVMDIDLSGASAGAFFGLFDLPINSLGTMRATTPGGKVFVSNSLTSTYDLAGADTVKVFVLHGDNSGWFSAYNTLRGTWVDRESLPPSGGVDRSRGVKKGSTLAGWKGSVYAARGNSTLDWWRYTPKGQGSAWTPLASIPSGAKPLKDGAAAAAAATGSGAYVFLLKASSTNEFYRYDVERNLWESRANAPDGLPGKRWKGGACIAWDGDSTLYALKNGTNELFAYDLARNIWTQRAMLPLAGLSNKKKRVKLGAGLACLGDYVFALKGGGTNEFWTYQPGADQWTQDPDLPSPSGKKVGAGGSLVAAYASLYALKGNKTLDFLVCDLNSGKMLRAPGNGFPGVEAGGTAHPAQMDLDVLPNPFRGTASVSYSLARPGLVSLRLYESSGRLVARLADGYFAAGRHSVILDYASPSLARGVYVLRLSADDLTATRKLVRE